MLVLRVAGILSTPHLAQLKLLDLLKHLTLDICLAVGICTLQLYITDHFKMGGHDCNECKSVRCVLWSALVHCQSLIAISHCGAIGLRLLAKGRLLLLYLSRDL